MGIASRPRRIALQVFPCYIFPRSRSSYFHVERITSMRIDRCIPILIVAALVWGGESFSLPRFASRTGARCQSCHINPSGGEMRQTYGVQYGRDQLPVPAWSSAFDIDDFSNVLTNFLGVGADFRTLFYYRQLGDTASDNRLVQMQGDLYLNFRVAKNVGLFLRKGLYSGFEVFGLFNLLPAHGSIKIGKFVPNFGTKVDDHTAYIRTYTGFRPEIDSPELTGGEVAVSPGPLTITGGFYNADAGADFGGLNNKKAFLGRAEGLFSLGTGVNLGLGGDVFTKQNVAGDRKTLMGGFGSFSYGLLSVFGEADLIRNTTLGNTVTGLVVYIEGDYMVTQGVDLKLAYDFYDPDKDLKTGAFSRYSVGVEFFPMGGLGVRPIYRILTESPSNKTQNEFDLMFHIYL